MHLKEGGSKFNRTHSWSRKQECILTNESYTLSALIGQIFEGWQNKGRPN